MPRRERDRSQEVLMRDFREPYINKATVAAIQAVFNRTRLSHQGWEPRQMYGRIDQRRVWRNDAFGNVDIFRERRLPSPTKLNVHLLVDASGSMGGGRICRAQDMVGTLIDAFKRIPTIRVHVWEHNATGSGCNIYRLYEPGKVNKLNTMLFNIAGGNADGFALQWIGDRALKSRRPDEQTLVIIISDGLPSVAGTGADITIPKTEQSAFVSSELRRKGCSVMGIAIAADKATHADMYGDRSTVGFDGDWNKLRRDIGATFGRVLADEDRKGR